MKKYTSRKALLKRAQELNAIDITGFSAVECYNLQKDFKIRKIGYSIGVYGTNSALYVSQLQQDEYFVITKRAGALFAMPM